MICWIESVSPVADLCLTNQIYSVLLNAFEFKEIIEVQNPHLKMLLEDGETRPRSCKYPTLPCTLAKITRDHHACLVSSNRECFAHFRQISYSFNKSSLSYVCIHSGNPWVPPRVSAQLASGPKLCGGSE